MPRKDEYHQIRVHHELYEALTKKRDGTDVKYMGVNTYIEKVLHDYVHNKLECDLSISTALIQRLEKLAMRLRGSARQPGPQSRRTLRRSRRRPMTSGRPGPG
jgi:hypothetical protein